ncbi:prolyl oligopeptidase-like protein [Sodiomyces alkalinus F11]|uniref:Prolyl oligopeptidase-like protein n=1 Tax=Sodiomyces alkalinus (strain CBS 110278 / VKM F-3762 / F11) TaxID=1314773 RepID=A0A3N2PMI7_SODAK|nr:prolyl oligopeptidase-like protein [Sodiomyces alkalinus F11]ROT35723.1 prolyl oligopeptidase-like protein [Sodiomyces alkalinus F11]
MMEHVCDSKDAELCKQILAVVSVIYRPISLEELTSTIESLARFDSDPAALETVIGSCGSFLTLREGTIYFIHQSAKDFLLNDAHSQILPSGIAHQHHAIFSRSLEVLSRTLRRDVYELSAPGFLIDNVSPPDPDPLAPVRYFCIHWVDHLRDLNHAEGVAQKQLQDDGPVHTFLLRNYLYWLEALSLLRSIPQAVLAMQKLEPLVGGSGNGQLADLLQDARRFVLSCKGALEIAPLQVYASALTFCPTRSLVGRLFRDEAPNWIISAPDIEADWITCLQTLEGHGDTVKSVTFSSDGQLLASASNDRTIKVWNATTGACMQTLEGHSDWVMSIAFSGDGRWLASASRDETVKVWDVATSACVQALEGHSDWVSSIAFSADGKRLASGSRDRTINIWDAATGACIQTLKGHVRSVTLLAFFANDQQLASGSMDKTVKVWNVAIGACIKTLEGHGDWTTSMAFSMDGQWLVSGSENDATAKIWNATTGTCIQALQGHNSHVASVTFSADGQRVASGSGDGTIKIWDTAKGACMQTLKGHREWALSVTFSPDGRRLASGFGDKTVKFWDVATDACAQTLEFHNGGITSVAFSEDGQWLASGAESDGTVKVWDTATSACVQTLQGHQSSVKSVCFSADGQRLISGSGDRTAKVWDVATGTCVQTLEGHTDWVTAVAFLRDGARLISMSDDGRPESRTWVVKVWNAETGACVRTLEGNSGSVARPSFVTRPNTRLSADRDVQVLDLFDTETQPQKISGISTVPHDHGYRISPDGVWIVKHDQRMLWLPSEYRPLTSAIYKSTIALGCSSGRVLIIQFSTEAFER